MRRIFLVLAAFGMFLGGMTQPGFAQQAPRRSVTYVFKQNPVAKAQFVPDASGSSPVAVANAASSTVQPVNLTNPAAFPGAAQGVNAGQGSNSVNANGGVADDPVIAGSGGGPRPNVQQMQNPSGLYNFSPTNSSSGQYVSGNNYLGSQFNNWNNLRLQPTTLDQFQAFNRTQPPTLGAEGAYISPNTYLGPAYGQWNNLSSGTAAPNYLGGYTYQP